MNFRRKVLRSELSFSMEGSCKGPESLIIKSLKLKCCCRGSLPKVLSFSPSFFWKWKVLRWYIYHVNFIYIWLVVLSSRFGNFFVPAESRGRSPSPVSFPVEEWRYIRGSPPCLCRHHPSAFQIQKSRLKWNKIFKSVTRSQGSPDDPNWPQMSWKQPQSGQGFIKYLPVMHVIVKDMLQILKRCKNNNKNTMLWPIFITLFRHGL